MKKTALQPYDPSELAENKNPINNELPPFKAFSSNAVNVNDSLLSQSALFLFLFFYY